MSSNKAPLRGAVIGYGFISGKGHVPAYLARMQEKGDVEIVALADLCEARRELAQKVLPEARIYTDAKSLILAEGRDLDFVDIAVPPCDHAQLAHLALDHGLHVLCEKPFTVTVEEAAAVLEHAERVKRVVFPAHNYKHAPVVKAIRETIASGKIGNVRGVTLTTYRNTHAKGVTEWNTHWRRMHRYSGGGIAMDHGSHSFYLTFDWMGAYPTAVTAKMSNLDAARWDTEDNFSAVLTFPNGLAHCQLSWTAGVRKQLYSVQGDKGAITVENDELEIAVMEKTDGEDVAQGAVKWTVEKKSIASHWMDASHVSWFNSLFDQFQAAIAQGEWVGQEAREAFLCVQLINAAYRSAQEGCRELPLSAEVPPVRSVGVR